jgi:hypothetical protein
MIFTPVVAGYVLMRLLQTRAERSVWLMVSGAALLALLISTFFWLPTVTERSQTHTAPEQYIATSDFHQRFLSFDRLLAPPTLLDDGEANADVPLSLGWVQLAAGIIGLMVVVSSVVRVGRLSAVPDAVFFLLVLGVSVFLQLPASSPVWDNVPLLPVAEFPWRFMGLSAFALAVLGGYVLPARDDHVMRRRNSMTTEVVTTYMFGGSDGNPRRRRGLNAETIASLVAALLVAAAIIAAFPYTTAPRGFVRLGTPTPQTVLQYEQSTSAYGLTTINEYLPQTVQQLPLDAPAPLGRAKIDLPASALLGSRWTPRGESDHINLAQAGPVRFRIFNYPGWSVTLDGKPVPLATQHDGTFTVQVPAGEHQIETRFEETPMRMAGNIVSGLSLMVLLPLLFMPLPHSRRWQPVWAPAERAEPGADGGAGWVAVILALVFIANFAVVDPRGWLHETRFTQPLAVFDGQVALMAGESDQSSVGRGGMLQARAYWEPLQALTANYHVIVQLIGSDGNAIAGTDKQHPGDPVVQGETPTTQIPRGKYLRDEHTITIPANAPPGRYELRVGLYDPATGKRLKLSDGGTLFAVGEVAIRYEARTKKRAVLAELADALRSGNRKRSPRRAAQKRSEGLRATISG